MKKPQITVCITGGHATPALAVADEVRRRHGDWKILWIGRKFALEGESIVAEEYHLVTEKGLQFLPLYAGRLTRAFTVQTVVSILKIPFGFLQALWYCVREKPNCIMSFGGYVALPVAVAGWFLGIPVITHEQTRVSGIANRIIGLLARRVCVTFLESKAFFPKEKTVITGLPIRNTLFHASAVDPIGIEEDAPLLYVTGGSTGAVSLNTALFPLIDQLTKDWVIIHQTGRVSFGHAAQIRQALPKARQTRYVIRSYVSENELAWIYSRARLVVGRSGANTIGELAALAKVGVLVPLPWSSNQEQQANAQWLESEGSAVVLDQRNATPQSFLHAIKHSMRDIDRYQANADRLSRHIPHDADGKVVDEIEKVIG